MLLPLLTYAAKLKCMLYFLLLFTSTITAKLQLYYGITSSFGTVWHFHIVSLYSKQSKLVISLTSLCNVINLKKYFLVTSGSNKNTAHSCFSDY